MGADGESAKQLFLPLLGGGIRERPPNKANAHLAAHALALRQPDESAIRTLTKPQAVAFILIAFCGMIWFMLAPTSFLEAAGLAAYTSAARRPFKL
jgi:hypothetical protein